MKQQRLTTNTGCVITWSPTREVHEAIITCKNVQELQTRKIKRLHSSSLPVFSYLHRNNEIIINNKTSNNNEKDHFQFLSNCRLLYIYAIIIARSREWQFFLVDLQFNLFHKFNTIANNLWQPSPKLPNLLFHNNSNLIGSNFEKKTKNGSQSGSVQTKLQNVDFITAVLNVYIAILEFVCEVSE